RTRAFGDLSLHKFGIRYGDNISRSRSYTTTSPFCSPKNTQSKDGSDNTALTTPGGEYLTPGAPGVVMSKTVNSLLLSTTTILKSLSFRNLTLALRPRVNET